MSEQSPLPDAEEDRRRFADRLEEAGVASRRFIDVRDGEKGTRTAGHQEPVNWLEADDPRLSGNYGVHPGYGLIEFDVDDYDDEHDTDALDALPETFTVKSPHTADDSPGHRYYAVGDNDVREVLQDIAETLNPEPSWGEIKYEGKYVVGPGSQLDGCDKEWCDECAKPDGGYYRIAEDRPIATLSADDLAEVLRADPEIGDGESEQLAATDVFDLPPEEEEREERESDEWMTKELAEETLGEISPDVGYNEWAAIGFALSNHFGEGRGGRLFREWSRSGTKWDSKADDLADRIISDANKYPHEISAFVRRAKEHGWDASAAAKEAVATADGGTAAVPSASPEPEETADDSDNDWGDVMTLFDSSTGGSTTRGYTEAAKLLERAHDFVTIRESGEMYYYNPEKGHYVRKGRTFIEELLQRYIPGYTNGSRVKNITEIVKARNYIDAGEFRPPAGKVNVANGVLDLDTRNVEPHTPEYYFTSRLKAAYHEDDDGEPVADAERWDRFLDGAVSPEAKKKIEEFIGYTLETWHHNREKNLFIVGPRQSGKSTCADTIQALHGEMPDVANLSPQQIADTQFDVSALIEASLNTVNDINASKIEDTGTLKRTFSGERQKLERKFHDAQFGALTAKHLFTANWLPRVVGEDESLYRRVLIVEFPNKVDDEDRDLNLKDDLKDELDGILVRALDARDRLHEQGGFTNDRSDTETRRKWDSWRDAHKRFLYKQFEITGDSNDSVEKETYYQAYKEFAGREGYELKPKQSVTKSLEWVPEIEVTDSSYAGLVFHEDDAAESGESGSNTGEYTTLTDVTHTQDELMTKLKRWIGEFESPIEGADMQTVYDYGESKGYDRDELSEKFEKLKDGGEVYNPQGREWRLTD